MINFTKKWAYMLIFNDLLQLRNKKKKNKYSWKEKKLYKKLLRNELKQKIVVINCTKKGA